MVTENAFPTREDYIRALISALDLAETKVPEIVGDISSVCRIKLEIDLVPDEIVKIKAEKEYLDLTGSGVFYSEITHMCGGMLNG